VFPKHNNKETVLNVDASIKGLGAVIMQDGKPVAKSKTVTTCERRYANNLTSCVSVVLFRDFRCFRLFYATTLLPPPMGLNLRKKIKCEVTQSR